MDNTQKGFAVIESFLILVIITVISGIGWYALHTKHQTDKILSQADKISQNTSVTSKESTKTTIKGIAYETQVPDSFKTQLQKDFQKYLVDNGTCATDKQFPASFDVNKNVRDKFVEVLEGCGGGGGRAIYVDTNGSWIVAETSNGFWTCDAVDKYKIPQSLIGICYSSDSSSSPITNTNL